MPWTSNDIIKRHAASDVRTFVQSCTDLSNLPTEKFDVVFASNHLEHLTLSEAGVTLDQARNALKPGGRLILLQPNFAYAYRQYFDDVSHMQIFTHVSHADFLKLHDFLIQDVKAKFLPFSMRAAEFRRCPGLSRFIFIPRSSPWWGRCWWSGANKTYVERQNSFRYYTGV
jgi:SAM-dependent methyltransferase